jgi:hypothetical protein
MQTKYDFTDLVRLYSEIDDKYEQEVLQAQQRGFMRKKSALQHKRSLNNHAYFLFMFSRLEEIVRERTAMLIAKNQNHPHWRHRRVWQILPNDQNDSRLDLMRRVELLFEKGNTEYNKIHQWKLQRDKIAHGGSFTKPMSVIQTANEMTNIIRLVTKKKI